jgi:N-glycosylase/DNA lyase
VNGNPAADAWSAWQPVSPGAQLPPHVLAELLDGGQAFRWHGDVDGIWTGVWSDCAAQLRLSARASALPGGSALEWRAPQQLAERVAMALPRYLALDIDWSVLTDALPWRNDPHLATAIRAFSGLRLLRQPFAETLLGFLCSATKQIVQIKQMLALLAECHGSALCRAESPDPASIRTFHRLPTWDELAALSESDLRRCQLGFRARYIAETARFFASHPGWLAETERLPYAAAKARLLELPGVGEKIADCVLLFGAGRIEAFPVDVWILKTLERRYGLRGWRPAQLGQFGRAHFGPYAGLAQQFLFAWERRHDDR